MCSDGANDTLMHTDTGQFINSFSLIVPISLPCPHYTHSPNDAIFARSVQTAVTAYPVLSQLYVVAITISLIVWFVTSKCFTPVSTKLACSVGRQQTKLFTLWHTTSIGFSTFWSTTTTQRTFAVCRSGKVAAICCTTVVQHFFPVSTLDIWHGTCL